MATTQTPNHEKVSLSVLISLSLVSEHVWDQLILKTQSQTMSCGLRMMEDRARKSAFLGRLCNMWEEREMCCVLMGRLMSSCFTEMIVSVLKWTLSVIWGIRDLQVGFVSLLRIQIRNQLKLQKFAMDSMKFHKGIEKFLETHALVESCISLSEFRVLELGKYFHSSHFSLFL